ncbi:uncharacterized protein BO95DRAFT_445814 [Aspergillus brunneoviolaceus CBS 621.78]|uniref:Uncharacterized protein n=1 Tax=Aspergillus brunneoviolaceus CBS 621.78 TaxID=1450534 RepID=A0ACD1G0L3_9EURO|nr:hypothetical protein BO95DRAFT_445814 [Aspergillus brunneoviolaceus CBS 621.78]RAH42708.1 hypothetical protein BO95DRAFT_445814 [Aspergillus brunneoviolaceus CBS 621.78]
MSRWLQVQVLLLFFFFYPGGFNPPPTDYEKKNCKTITSECQIARQTDRQSMLEANFSSEDWDERGVFGATPFWICVQFPAGPATQGRLVRGMGQ